MDFIKKGLKNLIFETKEVPAEKASTPAFEEQHGQILTSVPETKQVVTPTIQLTDAESEKYNRYFSKLFQDQNCPKPSYHELMGVVDAFSDMPPQQCFPRALKAVPGLTKDVALSTAMSTLSAVKNDQQDFNDKVNAKLTEEVGGQRALLQQKEADLKRISEEIAKLKEEIQHGEADLSRKKDAYNNASNVLQQKIQTDITSITTYIQ